MRAPTQRGGATDGAAQVTKAAESPIDRARAVLANGMHAGKPREALQELCEYAERMSEDLSREHVRLAGCGVAACGGDVSDVKPGSYGHSASLDDVVRLRKERDDARAEVARLEARVGELTAHVVDGVPGAVTVWTNEDTGEIVECFSIEIGREPDRCDGCGRGYRSGKSWCYEEPGYCTTADPLDRQLAAIVAARQPASTDTEPVGDGETMLVRLEIDDRGIPALCLGDKRVTGNYFGDVVRRLCGIGAKPVTGTDARDWQAALAGGEIDWELVARVSWGHSIDRHTVAGFVAMLREYDRQVRALRAGGGRG